MDILPRILNQMNIQNKIILSLILHVGFLFSAFFLLAGTISHKTAYDYLDISLFEEKTPPFNSAVSKDKNTLRQKKNNMNKAMSANNSRSQEIPSPDIAIPKDNITSDVSQKVKVQTKYQSSVEQTDIKYTSSSPLQSTKSQEIAAVIQGKTLSSEKISDNNTTDILSKIKTAVEKAKNYPLIARKNGIEGTVTTEFSINQQGFPENIRVVKSSGFNVLDSAALQTITKASPFPLIKECIEIPITFVLKK